MTETTLAGAIQLALRDELLHDPRVILMGLDIGGLGGLFGVTKGLQDEFGESRVVDTPLSESALVGAAVGAAMMGLRPIVELQFADFFTTAMDQLVNNAAKIHYLSNHRLFIPLVIRATFGFGAGAHHSQSPEPWLMNVPGLKIVIPTTPADAWGLLHASIRDGNPVVFLEHRKLYSIKGPLPIGSVDPIPLGVADIKRPGKDVTLVSSGAMLHRGLMAASTVSQEDDIDVEVVDLRTIRPLDSKTILESVTKTSRLVVVEETPRTGGIGSEVAALVSENALGYLDAPVRRVSAPDLPIPTSEILLEQYVPSVERIIQAIREVCSATSSTR